MFENGKGYRMKLLITGGTGSFGSTVLRKLMSDEKYSEIRILSRDELKQDILRNELKSEKLRFYLGDVRDKSSLTSAVSGVDSIFHAAALKQVPSCEFFPLEAAKTNVFGTANLLETACENNVASVVVLSTDKAVYPINAMGISKALMERVVFAKARDSDSSRFCVTRYGNVMASRGSVIPKFIELAKINADLPVTDPEMTRFLMSLDESVELVQHAFEHGNSGDLFVQKAPACTVRVLAQAIVKLFDSQSKIRVIGTRHGEKKYESLLSREEWTTARESERYFQVAMDNRDLNYDNYFVDGKIDVKNEDYNSHNTYRMTVEEVVTKLKSLEYVQKELIK